MAVQLDDGGGAALRQARRGLGLTVRTGAAATRGPHVARRSGRWAWRSPTATTSRPTWWCSLPASARATSSAATAGLDDRRARRRRRRRSVRHVGRRHLRDRRGGVPRRSCLRPGRPRATRWPSRRGGSARRRFRHVHGRRHVDPAEAARRRRRLRRQPPRRRRRRRRRRHRVRHVAAGRRRRRRACARRRAGRRRSAVQPLVQAVRSGAAPAVGVLELLRPIGAPSAGGPADLPDDAAVCSCHNVGVRRDPVGGRRRDHDIARPQGVHQGRHGLRLVRARAAGDRSTRDLAAAGAVVVKRTVRPLRDDPARAVRDRAGHRDPHVRRARRPARHRRWLRDLQAGASASMFASLGVGLHPRRRAGHPAGLERPLPRQHPARRHLLGGPAGSRRRDHAGAADRDRRGRPRLRPLHQDHRRAAHRPARRPGRAAARRSGRGSSPPGWSRVTPTARRCAR